MGVLGFKKKAVIIGASSFQNPLILKAKELGFETHVFAWKSGDIGEETADYFHPVSILEKEMILEVCKQIKPEVVVSIASDVAVLTVNYLSRKLGLNCNSEASDLITTNKYLMRQELRKNKIWTPDFIMVGRDYRLDEIKKMSMPLIVKPTDRSGSRGVSKVDRPEDISNAVEKAINASFEKKAIIETYIRGGEFSCECISFQGKHQLLAVTQKFTTGAPCYIETGHAEPVELSGDVIQIIKQQVFSALTALKISNSASHCEFKLNGKQIKIIEIGARMGGDCIGSHLVSQSTGYDFLKLVIDVAEGKEPKLEKVNDGFPSLIRFIIGEADRKALAEAKEDENVQIIEEKIERDGKRCVTDSSTRQGYFILKSEKIETIRKYYPIVRS